MEINLHRKEKDEITSTILTSVVPHNGTAISLNIEFTTDSNSAIYLNTSTSGRIQLGMFEMQSGLEVCRSFSCDVDLISVTPRIQVCWLCTFAAS